MNELKNYPPVTDSRSGAFTCGEALSVLSYYYWFTNPPAVLEGRTGCMQF